MPIALAMAASHTTPESFELQRLLAGIRDAGITHVVMEVSSHALELRRVEDCEFDLGIFMNLSQDHLDFHGTMEDYFASKKRFFTDLLAGEKNGRRQGRIINVDDPWGRRLAEELRPATGIVTFGIDSIAFIQAKEVHLGLGEIRAEIETPAGAFPLRAPLSGRFNLSNILAATAAAFHLGIPLSAIQRGIEIARPVPGRLEKISETGEPAVFVDYAHSEDALKRVLQNLAQFRKGRIITVFGCGGDRDQRPEHFPLKLSPLEGARLSRPPLPPFPPFTTPRLSAILPYPVPYTISGESRCPIPAAAS